MSIRTLPRALALVPALLLIVSSAALAQGLDDKTAIKLLKGDLKAIEKTHKDACKAALNDLKAGLSSVQSDIAAFTADAPPPPGAPQGPAVFLADIFAAYRTFAQDSADAEREANDDLALCAGTILNDPGASGAYPDGFVIGDGGGIDRTMGKVRGGSDKSADKAVKLAKRVLGSLEKDLGYVAQVSLTTSEIPGLAPVVLNDPEDGDPDPFIDRRAYGPTIDLVVVGRDPANGENDRLFVAGAVDETQILIGVQAVLTGANFQEAVVDAEVAEDSGRWSAVIETVEASDGICDPERGCGLDQGNYIASVRVDDYFEVTRAIGVP